MCDKMKQSEEKKENDCSVDPILKQGSLRKKSFLGEDERHFILQKNGVLSYEKGKGRSIEKKQTNLIQAKRIKKEGNFGIVIETSETKWTLNSSTTHDRDDWIKTMNRIDGVICHECCDEQD